MSDRPAVPLLRVSDLRKQYGTTVVLDDVSLTVAPGEFVAVLGPSGAGKTTLFRCLTRLTLPDRGEVWIGDQPLHRLHGAELCIARRDIGLIFQQFNLVRRLSAVENVLAGRLGYAPTWRVMLRQFSHADRQLALASLDRVGLLPQAYRRADSLSGGQQQRVAIARVLAQQSKLILADEPVASLDPESAASVLGILRAIAHEQGIGVLCSLHQVDLAVNFADRLIGLRAGRVIVDLPTDQVGVWERDQIYRAETVSTPAAARHEPSEPLRVY